MSARARVGVFVLSLAALLGVAPARAQDFTNADTIDVSSNYNAIVASNRAAFAVLKTLDTGTVCRVATVGPTAENIISINGSTQTVAQEFGSLGLDYSSNGVRAALVALVTNGMGAVSLVDIDESGYPSISGQSGKVFTAMSNVMTPVMNSGSGDLMNDFNDQINSDLEVNLETWCEGQLRHIFGSWPADTQITAWATFLVAEVGGIHSDMANLWTYAEVIALFANGLACFWWVILRKPNESAAPGTEAFAASVPALGTVWHTVGIGVLAGLVFVGAGELAMKLTDNSLSTVPGQVWEAVSTISGPQALANINVAGFLTDINGNTLTMSQFMLMWLDAAVNVPAMEGAIVGSLMLMVAQWVTTILGYKMVCAVSSALS